MTFCNCKLCCPALAAVAGAVIGVIAAFLQITGVFTVAPVFLWVVLGIAVAYLGILVLASVLDRRETHSRCLCASLNTVLAGILGSALLAAVLLAVGIVATSVLSAVLVGLLVFFLTLALAGSACLVRCLTGCSD